MHTHRMEQSRGHTAGATSKLVYFLHFGLDCPALRGQNFPWPPPGHPGPLGCLQTPLPRHSRLFIPLWPLPLLSSKLAQVKLSCLSFSNSTVVLTPFPSGRSFPSSFISFWQSNVYFIEFIFTCYEDLFLLWGDLLFWSLSFCSLHYRASGTPFIVFLVLRKEKFQLLHF